MSDVFRLAGIKFVRMWNFFPNSEAVGTGASRFVISLGYLGILSLTLLTVVSMIRKKSQSTEGTKQTSWCNVVLCSSPAVYFTALHMVFVSSIRYRQPAVLVFTVLAGVGVAYCVSKISSPPLGIQEGGMHG